MHLVYTPLSPASYTLDKITTVLLLLYRYNEDATAYFFIKNISLKSLFLERFKTLCVCVCVCERERERERKRNVDTDADIDSKVDYYIDLFLIHVLIPYSAPYICFLDEKFPKGFAVGSFPPPPVLIGQFSAFSGSLDYPRVTPRLTDLT